MVHQQHSFVQACNYLAMVKSISALIIPLHLLAFVLVFIVLFFVFFLQVCALDYIFQCVSLQDDSVMSDLVAVSSNLCDHIKQF